MPAIVLATLNARYSHASLGLRCLLANLGELRETACLAEFTLQDRPMDIAEKLLALAPRLVGFGVYIWNARETAESVALLKQVRPDLLIVLGGPEVSYEYQDQAIVAWADYLITGQAELAFAQLCRQLLAGQRPPDKVIHAQMPRLAELASPYRFYTDQDIAHRNLYVEASRGCPFKCEFCLSALDKTAYPFDLAAFLAEIEALWARGARHFKFVDRTFNLKPAHSQGILEFFLARLEPGLFLHFELIPDHLPAALKALIQRFPPGSLQFEIGIQTFNPQVQALIGRKQDNAKAEANLRFLRRETQAHLHTDLIIGLPGEDLDSFAAGFDRLIALNPHEIQVGILKRLRGAPIDRHTASRGMRYQPFPPYQVLLTDCLDFATLQRLSRFARYWDVIGNAGRFSHSLPRLLGDQPFARFLCLSDWLYEQTGQTHQLALDRLFHLIYRWARELPGIAEADLGEALGRDYQASGLKKELDFLGNWGRPSRRRGQAGGIPARQARHLGLNN
jgi:hypothetical protein